MAVTSRAVFLPKEARSRDASADVLVLEALQHALQLVEERRELDGVAADLREDRGHALALLLDLLDWLTASSSSDGPRPCDACRIPLMTSWIGASVCPSTTTVGP